MTRIPLEILGRGVRNIITRVDGREVKVPVAEYIREQLRLDNEEEKARARGQVKADLQRREDNTESPYELAERAWQKKNRNLWRRWTAK